MDFYNINDESEVVNFEQALLKGMGFKYGLYMMANDKDLPQISRLSLNTMGRKKYASIAFEVLYPFLQSDIAAEDLERLLSKAYPEEITPKIIYVNQNLHILWLTAGPTYSFKDYAARFYGQMLNYFLLKRGQRRLVIVATSGDTGSAMGDALFGLEGVDYLVYYPKDKIYPAQRRQMTTLKGNVYAFEVKGTFDTCQALAKYLLNDKEFALAVFGDADRFTSANSISLGRLLPQIVYPFYAYSRLYTNDLFTPVIPSGNFGDMMGTVIAKYMGLPVGRMIIAVNENDVFPVFLKTGEYQVKGVKNSPSSAMNVANASNFARLVDFYGGHVEDIRDEDGRIIEEGRITVMPDLANMRRDMSAISITNREHYLVAKNAYQGHKIILDPHGAVGWAAFKILSNCIDYPGKAILYETADPGKFPDFVKDALGLTPELPAGMLHQAQMEERIYAIKSEPDESGRLSLDQVGEAKEKIKKLFPK